MKRLIIGLVLVVLLLVPVSCAGAKEGVSSVTVPSAPSSAPSPTVPAPSINVGASPREGVSQGGTYVADGLPGDEERMIVRTANMDLVVKDVTQTLDNIVQLATKYEGFVVSSQVSGEEQDMRGWISIRVVDDKLDQSLAEIRSLAVRVKSESTSGQDVTEQYMDLDARLSNAEATEKQYLELLNKATAVEDILKIYQSLSQVRQDIEQIKTQMLYLERTSSLSLISVSLEPEATTKPLVKAGWSALEALKSAVRGIVTFGQWLGTLAIWLLIFIPVWGTIVGIIWWRRRKKSQG
jgi:hypothetical protein